MNFENQRQSCLATEPSKNPGQEPMTTLPISNGTRSWFAVYTATNHEKSIAQHLRMREIETFLPLYSVTKRWKNRTTAKVDLPLFAGYIFVRIAPTERVRVLEVPMVYSVVGNRREPTPLPDDQIEGLRVALQGGQAHPFPYVKVGNRVRVRSGAFAGLEGVVVRTYGGLSVVLSVDMIQKSVAVHVEADELESCGRTDMALSA
jgi:transcription antitermination factor NusG